MNWYILTKNHNNIIKKLSVFGKWGGKSRYCKQTNVRYKRVTEVHFLPWKNNQNVNQTAMQRRNGGAAWVGAFNHIQTLTWLGCQTPLWRRILDNQILRIFPHIRFFFFCRFLNPCLRIFGRVEKDPRILGGLISLGGRGGPVGLLLLGGGWCGDGGGRRLLGRLRLLLYHVLQSTNTISIFIYDKYISM